ncbi:hypothetical protein PDO_2601 [Rhizobium sp. PDO1-076]|uniref:hypothetical protein n=1 Tax=Rhizobium sp. PDO1-076 TaxID=1125979 RepID=UPI00024E2F1F|nr:hypothetical protein [Rhizobium sp. PDO1-076]EHS50336.1 hypothetical protein PDO_2601 [Rhizobium sp. PDO1-076]
MKMMNSAVLAGLLAAAIGASPALAEQSELSRILFGRSFNDNVTAVQVGPSWRDTEGTVPFFVMNPHPVRIRAAQAEVAADAGLRAALQVREIAAKNVIWVQTAANGGKIVYYR